MKGERILFVTKFWKNSDYNEKEATITAEHHTKEGYRYDLKFDDGHTIKNVYSEEVYQQVI